MRTQPEVIIQQLEADNSRLAKEAILEQAMAEGLDEFFEGVRWCLDKLHTFGVKQVPISEQDGQGLSWANFSELSDALYRRTLMLSSWPWMYPLKNSGTDSIVGS